MTALNRAAYSDCGINVSSMSPLASLQGNGEAAESSDSNTESPCVPFKVPFAGRGAF